MVTMVRGQLSGKNVSNPHLVKSPDSKPVLGTKNAATVYPTGKKTMLSRKIVYPLVMCDSLLLKMAQSK